jgi:hypothetical protein
MLLKIARETGNDLALTPAYKFWILVSKEITKL